ncbi:translation initiation factor SUI1, putative [Plasmodium vivax]|uniref:Translation initiation factor SUI1, putative n=1 Tax=Plasmodium vivax TaxID=5855 RepID=A0A1G4GV17_PLAVI|nr:translation initiation factor SUI1, putative [Plasmodium vivax]
MFKSKIALGNKNFLGNKDRKKLAATIKSTFNLESDEQVDEILDKENTSICKVQKTKITIYFSKNIPVLFSIKNDLFPTVYTLWKFPRMIPCFVIYPPASEFLMKGADLMIPGICKEVDHLEALKEGSVWGVRVFNNPHLFAVGQCSVDYDSNNCFYNLKGKCLKVVHIFNDELWRMGSQTVPHSSFQGKIIDSVENVVDNFDEFRVYDESKGKKKAQKGGQQRGKQQRGDPGGDVGTGADGGSDALCSDPPNDEKPHEDPLDNRYRAFTDDESEQEKPNGEGDPAARSEPKPTGKTSEKSLDNFYKHFAVILAQRSHAKGDAPPPSSKNAKGGKKQTGKDTQFKEQNPPSEVKKKCTVGIDSMEESSHKRDTPEEEKTNQQKKHHLHGNPATEQGKRDEMSKAVDNSTHTETDVMNEWDECSAEENEPNGQGEDHKEVSLKKAPFRSESKEAKYDDEETVSEASFVEEPNVNMPQERNEKDTFALKSEQQDALLMFLFLEVAHSLSDDNLPLEVSGVYSRMTKEFLYIHRNEAFLGELQKLGVPTDIANKIKAKEVNLQLDVKKSTYKKISKFVQHCSKLKLIKIKENRNVMSVVNIRRGSSVISSYKPMSLEEKKLCQLEGGENDGGGTQNGAECTPNSGAHQDKSTSNEATNKATSEATNKGVQVLEFYMPSSKGINIFKCVDSKTERSSYYNIMQLKDVLKSYVQSQKLVSGKDPQVVQLNDDLRAVLNGPCESSTMPYESLLSQFVSTQLPCYAIIKPYANFDVDPIKVTKGKCPSIHIYAVARMKGKKYVTHITNLFLFHVDLNKFTEHVQKQLACSCSIVLSPSTKKEEVLVQGNVVNMIHDILIRNYSLPRKYIALNTK